MNIIKSWKGKTNTGDSYAVTYATIVKNLTITNKSADPMTLNLVTVLDDGTTEINLSPQNLIIAAGESYGDFNRVFEIGETIKFTVDKDCDFHFSIEEKDKNVFN